MAEIKASNYTPDNNFCRDDLGSSIEKSSTYSRTTRGHRYKNMLHLWEFLLELLADESCRTIIRWRRKECGEFKLINQHEVAKRWGLLKQKGDMNYGKLSRALRLYYQEGIIRKVRNLISIKVQMLKSSLKIHVCNIPGKLSRKRWCSVE